MINQIINSDCLEGMKQLSDGCVDLTVTSPPYDGLRAYNGYNFDFENIARELYRVTKFGGVVVWVVGDATVDGSETGTSFRQALYFKDVGFSIHDTMIYAKTGIAFPETNRYYPCFEYMFVLSKGKPKTVNLIEDRKNNQSGVKISGKERQIDGTLKQRIGEIEGREVKEYGVRTNLWTINSGYMKSTTDEFAYQHPAMFPEKLAEDHIISWSNPGDLVMDIFTGSGTTAKMAIANGRKFIGFEISRKYAEIARRRIEHVQPVMNF